MPQKAIESETADLRWKDLYRIGGISSVLIAAAVLFAIAAYFIWPYKGDFISTENIFSTLQTDRLGGLISLDLPMLLIVPINILLFLALYVVLKRVNESYALMALVLALTAVVLLIPTKPLVELTFLSDKYAAATTVAEKSQYLAAGESLRALFTGTAWITQTVFFMLAGLINCLLMLRTHLFSKTTAWVGIVISTVGLGFFIPVIGLVLLFINTFGTVLWCLLVAQDFFKLERRLQVPSK